MLYAPILGEPDPDLEQSIEDFLPVAQAIRAKLDAARALKAGTPAHQAHVAEMQDLMSDVDCRAVRHGMPGRQFLALLYAEIGARRSGKAAKRAFTIVGSSPELLAAEDRETEARRVLNAAQVAFIKAKTARIAAEKHALRNQVSI